MTDLSSSSHSSLEVILEKEKISDDSVHGKMTFRGELAIQDAVQIKDEIKKAIDEVDVFSFDLSEVDSIDLSFIQLMHSAYLYAQEKKKTIFLEENMSEEIDNLFQKSGFDQNEWFRIHD